MPLGRLWLFHGSIGFLRSGLVFCLQRFGQEILKREIVGPHLWRDPSFQFGTWPEEKVAAEFESHGEVSVEQSKYLGGVDGYTGAGLLRLSGRFAAPRAAKTAQLMFPVSRWQEIWSTRTW